VLHGDGTKGATISADNKFTGGCGSGKGGTINLAATGDITTEDGSVVTVGTITSKCSGGTISMQAGNAVDIDGVVKSESIRSGTGATQAPGGGPITINAGCDLTISDTGYVSSMGVDPGADLVHLQGGCKVVILGLVQSTGVGHGVPNNPPNHCNNSNRSDKPEASTACVEVWAGDMLTVDSTDDNNGEINADTGHSPGGSTGTSWIDLFARGDIQIFGDTYAVHANGNAGSDNGGVVTTTSTEGKITASGKAIQADGSQGGSGGHGGTINVNAKLDVDLSAGTLEARGTTAGDSRSGGTINVQSFNGNIVSDTNSKLDVFGGPPAGAVALTSCGTLLDSEFPPGTVTPVSPTKTTGVCGGTPSLPSYVILPKCECGGGGLPPPFCEKAAVKEVLDPVTGRFLGNNGPDVIVKAHLGDVIQTAVDGVLDTNIDGYLIVGVVAKDNGLLGGHVYQSVIISKAYNLPFALIACSVTLHDPTPGDGDPTAHITTTASSPQNIFVMDLHAADSQVAGWLVEGNGRYMRNVKVTNNAVGISFQGDGNTMHNGAAEDNTGVGILIHGSGNLVDSSDSMDNGGIGIQVIGNTNKILKADVGDRGKGNVGDGINVAGNGNTIQENDIFANVGDGIGLTGNSNFLYKNDVGDRDKGNGGDGMRVAGYGNKLQENNVYANMGDGIDVSGGTSASPNVMLKNKVGDRGKGNLGNGIIVSGIGNGKLAPTEIDQNVVKANGGVGIQVTGSGHQLKSNQSGGSGSGESNGGCEYDLAAGNFDSGGNKANGAGVALTIPGCTGV
jgi:hypothetical protein